MAGKKKRSSTTVTDYQYPDKTRKNIPPAGLAAQGKLKDQPKIQYSYNPHLPPVLRFDASGQTDQLTERAEALLNKATREPLTQEERDFLAQALQARQPWLEWSGKRERDSFGVDPVALHIHERVSAQAVLKAAKREDIQRDLFADPQQDYAKATQFYQHDIEWANRLILGDSAHVMTSLAKREALAGKVQMIYIDPPYGIKFNSNWQNEVGKLEMKEKGDAYLTREPEMIKAYRDTFMLGVHSYLDYLKQRLIVAWELLADSGSVFLQISDENVHLVRALMDEVFGKNNFIANIIFQKTGGFTQKNIILLEDYVLWYSKD
jgi:adenine-specific DNA-methyltransferase